MSQSNAVARIVAHDVSQGVVASVVETQSHRMLLSGTTIVGAEHLDPSVRSQPAFAAMALMQVVAFLVPSPTRALCLGLGAGTAPQFLHAAGIETEVVEIDAAVAKLATSHFLFGAPFEEASTPRVHVDDAVAFLDRRPSERFDLVLSDLWTGGNHGHALTRGFLSHVRSSWLHDGGVLAINLVAFIDGPHTGLALRVLATMRSLFNHVRCFAEVDVVSAEVASLIEEPLNVLVVGSDASLRFDYDGFRRRMGDEPRPSEPSEPGSSFHLFESFESWGCGRANLEIATAAAGPVHALRDTRRTDGELIESVAAGADLGWRERPILEQSDWEELAADRAAISQVGHLGEAVTPPLLTLSERYPRMRPPAAYPWEPNV